MPSVLAQVNLSVSYRIVLSWLLYRNSVIQTSLIYPFDAHCCHMSTAIIHYVPDRVKLSFVIFDIRAL